MQELVQHSEHVYSSAQQKSAAASSPIVASWRRCMTMHRLQPEEKRAPARLSEAEFREARGNAENLIREAVDELDRLFHAVGRAGCCLGNPPVFNGADQ